MPEYIRRELLPGRRDTTHSTSTLYSKGWNECLDAIAEIPSEAVEHPVECGEWEEENRRPKSGLFICSVCKRTAYDPQPMRNQAWKKRCRYAYCPNCGAQMRRE